jgi:hypothetical protein
MEVQMKSKEDLFESLILAYEKLSEDNTDYIPLEYTFNKDIIIRPIFDVHVGTILFNLKEWKKFKKQILSTPNMYIVIGGDLADNATKNSKGNCYKNVLQPSLQKQWLIEQLTGLEDRILCVIPGNHEINRGKEEDNNILYDVCVALKITDKYRENIGFIKIKLGKREGYRQTYAIAVTHGEGSEKRAEDFSYGIDRN